MPLPGTDPKGRSADLIVKSMRKYKFQILIIVLTFASIGSCYYSYLLGVTTAHEASIASTLPILQKQYECIKISDQKCINITNETLLKITHVSAKSLLNNGLGIDKKIEEKIVDFEVWYRSLGNE